MSTETAVLSEAPRASVSCAPEAQPAPAPAVAQLVGVAPDDRAVIALAAAGVLSNQGVARLARQRRQPGRAVLARSGPNVELLGPVGGVTLPGLPAGEAEAAAGGPAPAPAVSPPPPPVPGTPAPAGQQQTPSADAGTPKPAGTPPASGGDSWYDKAGQYLSGEKKIKVRVGSWNLWNKQATRGYAFKPESKALKGVTVPLVLLPMPPPVGPVLVTLKLNVNAFAGARAAVTGRLENLEFDATLAQLVRAGVGAAELATGVLAVPGVIALAGVELPGHARLVANADATADAGVQANAEIGINPELWPIAGYIKASLGVNGHVGAHAEFDGQAALKMTALGITVTDFASKRSATLEAGLGILGSLEAGADVGYLVTVRQELLRRTFHGDFGLEVKRAVEGGDFATLSVGHGGGSNEPTLDLQRLVINAGNALDWLVKQGQANDNKTAFKAGEAPGGQPPVDLQLPQSKSHHLDLYQSMLGRLHHRPNTSDSRDTDQTAKWLQNVRAEGAERLVGRAIDLGMFDEKVSALRDDPTRPVDPAIHAQLEAAGLADNSDLFLPRWNRTRRTGGRMNADHKIEYQTYPVPAVDEPWNFELLDGPTNKSAGSTIRHYMEGVRALLPPQWQTQTLYFTSVTGGGGGNFPRGETWQTDQIVAGEHLDAFAQLYPEVVATHKARNFPNR
jgi:hypothetical protein